MKMECCPLCLEPCKIPVEITGFPCYRSEEIHCHTMIRYCKACCLTLFELNRPREDRKDFLKCLYCDTSVNPRMLLSLPFRTDHFQIRHDPVKDLKCSSCDHLAQDHSCLEKHCSQECEQFPRLFCNGCGAYHASSTPHRCSSRCPWCDEPILEDQYSEHLVEYHEMQACEACGKFTSLSLEQHGETECICRRMDCKYCPEQVEALHFPDHLLFHMEESKQRCELLKDILDKEEMLTKKLLHECRDFYGRVYQESIF